MINGFDEYEKEKSKLRDNGSLHAEQLKKILLDYRRENDIFEVGDKVVFNSYRLDAGISVIHNYHNGCIVAVFRHATDDEIKVGHRL